MWNTFTFTNKDQNSKIVTLTCQTTTGFFFKKKARYTMSGRILTKQILVNDSRKVH